MVPEKPVRFLFYNAEKMALLSSKTLYHMTRTNGPIIQPNESSATATSTPNPTVRSSNIILCILNTRRIRHSPPEHPSPSLLIHQKRALGRKNPAHLLMRPSRLFAFRRSSHRTPRDRSRLAGVPALQTADPLPEPVDGRGDVPVVGLHRLERREDLVQGILAAGMWMIGKGLR